MAHFERRFVMISGLMMPVMACVEFGLVTLEFRFGLTDQRYITIVDNILSVCPQNSFSVVNSSEIFTSTRNFAAIFHGGHISHWEFYLLLAVWPMACIVKS